MLHPLPPPVPPSLSYLTSTVCCSVLFSSSEDKAVLRTAVPAASCLHLKPRRLRSNCIFIKVKICHSYNRNKKSFHVNCFYSNRPTGWEGFSAALRQLMQRRERLLQLQSGASAARTPVLTWSDGRRLEWKRCTSFLGY